MSPINQPTNRKDQAIEGEGLVASFLIKMLCTNADLFRKNASVREPEGGTNASSSTHQTLALSNDPCQLQFVRVGDTTENLGCRLNCKKSPTCIIANMPGTQKPGREIVKPCRVKIMRWWRWMKVDNEGPAFAPRGGWIHFGPKPPKSGRWWGDRKKWSNPGASEETAGLWGRRRWCQRLCKRGVGLWCRPRCRWWRRARVLENGRNKIFQSSLIPPTDNSKSILTVFSRIIGT